jgi:hypothetical protein
VIDVRVDVNLVGVTGAPGTVAAITGSTFDGELSPKMLRATT